MNKLGIFITFEGVDGSGKSTQLRLLADHLAGFGCKVRVTREPGGTRVGEQIRKILLSSANPLTPLAELLLMYAAREQHLEEVVRPALARGELVLSDRFNDASFAYQGCGRKLGARPVRLLDDLICGDTQPDLTLVLDAPPRVALKRLQTRLKNSTGRQERRFEDAGLRFQQVVREAYLEAGRREPVRMKLVRATRPVDKVQAEIRSLVKALLAEKHLCPNLP
ncbi:MAG: dTMP kinase [Terriglobia bacterium]